MAYYDERSPNQGYVYTDGMSESDHIRENAFGSDTGYGFMNFADPIGGIIRAFNAKKSYKKARQAFEARQDWEDENARDARDRVYAGRLTRMQGEEDTNRGRALSALGLAFGDGQREVARERDYGAELADALATLDHQYTTGQRDLGIALARKGLKGGSVDAEKQTGLGLAYETGAASAADQAAQRLEAGRRADANQLSTLRRAYLVGDPQQAAQYAALASSNAAGARRADTAVGFTDAYAGIRGQRADNWSRAYGGALRSGARSFEIDQDAKGQGYRGLYSWG